MLRPESPQPKKRKSGAQIKDGPQQVPKNCICINLTDCKHSVIHHVCENMLNWRVIKNDETNMNCDIMWNDTAANQDQLGRLKAYQKLNHMPGIVSIARKNFLAFHLNKMKKQFPENYDFFPVTYCLPSEKNLVLKEFDEKKKDKVFIIKPEASSQGRGIFLARRPEEIPLNEGFVAQRYVKNPLLIDGLKFDLRIYVLVTSVAPLKLYIYKEGIARFATEEYNQPNSKSVGHICQHLTNYAVNKSSKKFEFDDNPDRASKGHKRSLSSVWSLLESQGVDTKKIFDNIKKGVLKTMCSIQPILKHIYVSSQPEDFTGAMCFEVLGFDVLIKKNLKPVILEVNHAPSFNTDTPFDFKVKSSMLKNAFELLDVNIERRNYIIDKEKQRFQERFRQGVRQKVPLEEKEKAKAEYTAELEEKIKEKLGLFELVYPRENADEPYEEFMEFADKMHLIRTGITNTKKRNSTVEKDSHVVKRALTVEEKENQQSSCNLAKVQIKAQQKVKFEQIQESVNRLYAKNPNIIKANKEARLEKARTLEIETKTRNLDFVKTNIVTFDFDQLLP